VLALFVVLREGLGLVTCLRVWGVSHGALLHGNCMAKAVMSSVPKDCGICYIFKKNFSELANISELFWKKSFCY
jgi:hypothetical protein